MKKNKILLLGMVMLSVFLFSGCGNQNVTLNLEKVKENVSQLKSDEYHRASAADAMFSLDLFGTNLEDIYTLSSVGITEDYIVEKNGARDYSMAITKEDETGYSYFIGKPEEGSKEALQKELDLYYQKAEEKNVLLKSEINGYLVYLVSKDNDLALSTLKENGYTPLFAMLMEVDAESLEDYLGIKKEDVEEYLIELPVTIVSSQSYFVIKPKAGKEATVKEAMKEYMANQEEQWSTYLADQYELVKNRKETKLGDYLIYIISKDNDKVLSAIKDAQTK